MTIGPKPICSGCAHFKRDAEYLTCDAFAVIPDPILDNQADHRKPIDGDHGILFEPVDEAAAAYAAEVFKR